MNNILNAPNVFPAEAVDALIARIGPWRMVVAVAAHLLRRRPMRPPDVADLPDYLRHDIGLGAQPPRLRPRDNAAQWRSPGFRM